MITISINPQTPAQMAILGKALIALLGEDAPVAEAAQEPAPADDTPAKRTRRTKEEMAQAPKPADTPVAVEPVATTEPTAPGTTATEAPSKALTLEDVRAKLAAISQSGKTGAVKELLTSFGVAKLTDLKADQYTAILEKAAAL